LSKNSILSSFKYAFNGFKFAWHERNFKLHLISTTIVLVLGFYFSVNAIEWCILFICIGLVLMAELFNTAIEKLVDLISPQIQPKAGAIKDLAAAAVLVISISAAIIGLIIFWPYLLSQIIRM